MQELLKFAARRAFIPVALAVLAGIAAPLSATSAADEIKTFPITRWLSDGSGTAKQTKGKVTIEATLLQAINEYDFPQVFAFTQDDLRAAKVISQDSLDLGVAKFFHPDATGKTWVNILGSPDGKKIIATFWIKVRNDTDHIINFSKDSKMFVQITGLDEPVGPVKDLSAQVFPSLVRWEKEFEETRDKGFLSVAYPVGFAAKLFDWRFGRWQEASFQNKDILPGFSASGLILFSTALDTAQTEDVALMLYEVPTDTDAAGAITARSRFTFRFARSETKAWWNKDTGRAQFGDPPKQ